MKSILARGGIEFLAVFLGLGLTLWVENIQSTSKRVDDNNRILQNLYENLELDSTDAEWNMDAYKVSYDGAEKVLQWCVSQQPSNDSMNVYISRLAITIILLNNSEEYNSLKSSGNLNLIKDSELIRRLHSYYAMIDFVKQVDEMKMKKVNEQFLPFMRNYCNLYGWNPDINVYKNFFPSFNLISNPPREKLSYFASQYMGHNIHAFNTYKDIVKRVSELRKLIRKEIST